MSRHSPVYLALPVIAALGISGGAFAQSTIIIAPHAPPPPRTEVIPPPPAPEANVVVWRPGHWAWNGSDWEWVAGSYVQRPQPAAVWHPGSWVQGPNGWTWADGHW